MTVNIVNIAELVGAAATRHLPTQATLGQSIIPADHEIRMTVTPGATVALPPPFLDAAAFEAKTGDGNLAIRVGDTTIVLQGYVAANERAPVIIETADGRPVDVASVLAQTDPTLDIQTAAGPATGAQGEPSGHLLAAFAPGGGLGGLAAVGPLDQTELGYRLIDNAIRQEIDLRPGSTVAGSLAIGNSSAEVDEAALSIGSDPSSDAETTTGTVHVSASSGVQSITIDGVTVDLTDPSSTAAIKGNHGTLTVTGWDAATGELTYTYTLASAMTNDDVQGRNTNTGEEFTVTVTDSAGRSASGDVTITVIDDVPVANADSAVTCNCGDASGNVLANDTAGADGIARISALTDGSHVYTIDASGTLTTNDDPANYSYDAATGVLTIYTTSQGGELQIDLTGTDAGSYSYHAGAATAAEDFQYTIVDGDGDTSTASLTITTPAATASDDHIFTLTDDFSIANSWLMANDGPSDGISVTGTADAHSLTVTDLGWGQEVTLDSGATGGSFTYEIAATNGSNDTANVAVDLMSSATHAIDQSASTADLILVGDAYDNVLTAGSGNDVLVGNGGTDTLYGNGGNDTLVYDSQDMFYGGDGTDRLTFGNGADIGFDSGFTDRVHSVEVLDIRNGLDDTLGSGTGEALSITAVLDMTDGAGELWIAAESGDKVTLAAGFTQVSDVTNSTEGDGIPNGTYATYTATDGTHTVVVHVESAQIQVA